MVNGKEIIIVIQLFNVHHNGFYFIFYSHQLLKAAKTLQRFPDTDPEALEAEFPDIK